MPRLPGISPLREPGPINQPTASPATYGANTGQAMAQLGQTLLHVGSTIKDAWDESRSAKEQAKALQQLQDFQLQLQYGGQDPETKEYVPPPSPDKHKELFDKEVERIREEAGKNLGGQALRMFSQNFNMAVTRQDFSIKQNAIDLMKNETKANTKDTLSQQAKLFVEAGSLEKPNIQRQAMEAVDGQVKRGMLLPAEGLALKNQFIKDANVGTVRKLIRDDPYAAQTALENGEFHDLEADEQQIWLDRAKAAIDREESRQDRLRSRQEADAAKAKKELEEKTFKDLYSRGVGKGPKQVSLDEVLKNQDNLSEEKFKLLYDMASGRGGGNTDMRTYSALRKKAAQGFDVTDEAVQAANNGLLDKGALDGLITESDNNSPSAGRRLWYKHGKSEIARVLTPKPDSPNLLDELNSQNEALDDFEDWAKAHQGATEEQARKERDKIIRERRLVTYDNITATLPTPRFMRSRDGMGNPDAIYEATRDTFNAFDKGEIDKYEARKEISRLRHLKNITPVYGPEQKGPGEMK